MVRDSRYKDEVNIGRVKKGENPLRILPLKTSLVLIIILYANVIRQMKWHLQMVYSDVEYKMMYLHFIK